MTGYVVEKKEQDSNRWVRNYKFAQSNTSYTVTDLKTGLEYEFRVSAENKAGISKPSDPTRPTLIKPPCGKEVIFDSLFPLKKTYNLITIMVCILDMHKG